MICFRNPTGNHSGQTLFLKVCVLFSCLLIFIVLGGISPGGEKSSSDQPIESPPMLEVPHSSRMTLGTVVRVLDGDTVIIDAHDTVLRYQVLGANAPEVSPNSRKQVSFSYESKRFLEQLLLGEQVYIQYDPLGKRDGAKRWTAYLYRAPDMLFVNLELIRQGYAKYEPKGCSVHNEICQFYETKAKELKRGIWNPQLPDQNKLEFEPEPNIEPEVVSPAGLQPEKTPRREVNQPKTNTDENSSVYITKYGKKYHRKNCPHLTGGRKVVERDSLDESLMPCKTCRPDG